MNISRRSFLKMAGLTTVAAAGAAMFTGCGLDMVTVNMVIVDDSLCSGRITSKQVAPSCSPSWSRIPSRSLMSRRLSTPC